MAMFEIDAREVAPRLGLAPGEFRRLMDAGRISLLCERGVGEDTGRHRVTFFHGKRRARWIIDADGRFDPI